MKNHFNSEESENDKEIKMKAAQEILNDPNASNESRKQALETLQSPQRFYEEPKPRKQSYSRFKWPSKKTFAVGLILIMMFSTFAFIAGTNMAYSVAYKEGALNGYTAALADTANLLQQKGITLDWNAQTDGSYKLTVTTPDGKASQITVAANLIVEIRDKNGNLKETARGAGTFTDLGKNWTVSQLSNVTNVIGTKTAPNATQFATYMSESLSAAGIGTSSQILPSEITDHGLQRASGTTNTFISTGSWNTTVVKTVITGSQAVVIWGLNYGTYASDPNSLIAYDQTPGTKNLAIGDTETETWTITIT